MREQHGTQRAEVSAEIQALLSDTHEDGASAEVLGLLPVQDRLDDLRRRLAQIESLIRAAGDDPTESEKAWPPELGAPLIN